MKAVVIHRPSSAQELILEERPTPTPADGQVLIRVKAFGLNRSELMTRKGLSPNVQFPRVLGIECVGEVENNAIRMGKPVVEDAMFGFRAAAPALSRDTSFLAR